MPSNKKQVRGSVDKDVWDGLKGATGIEHDAELVKWLSEIGGVLTHYLSHPDLKAGLVEACVYQKIYAGSIPPGVDMAAFLSPASIEPKKVVEKEESVAEKTIKPKKVVEKEESVAEKTIKSVDATKLLTNEDIYTADNSVDY